jgi:hypothetical protein
MLKRLGSFTLGAAMLAGAAYAAGTAKPAATPTINDSMTHVMAVDAQTIWDITSKAFNKKGDGLDRKKLTADDWKQLGAAGRRLKERATVLATAKKLVVTGPGEQMMGEEASHGGTKKTWDAASPKQVEALIAANPKGFSQHAWTLARGGADLEKAAKTRNVKVLYRVSANLDEMCDGCHQPFWGTDEPPPPPKGLKAIVGR